jgi:hypothetical protein
MKTKLFIFVLAILLASCSNNENEVSNQLIKTNPEDLYAKTEYNLDMRDFAMAVNEAINTNKSFRKLVKEEAMKKFDGDYDILLTNVAEKQISHNDVENGINTPNKVKSNFTVRDLLEDAFYVLNKKNKLQSVKAITAVKQLDSRQKAPSNAVSLIDELTDKYPNLQISVPVHAEDLEDDSYIPPVTFLPKEYDEITTNYLLGLKNEETFVIDAQTPPDNAVIVIGLNDRLPELLLDDEVPTTPKSVTATQTQSGILLSWEMDTPNTATCYVVYRMGPNDSAFIPHKTIYGEFNTSWNDNQNLVSGAEYSYRITAKNDFKESPMSIKVSAQAPSITTPLTSFNAILNSNKQVELNWINSSSSYIEKVVLSKYVINKSSGYQKIKEFPRTEYDFIDQNVVKGDKIRYKIQNTSPMGDSSPLYDIVKIPYRDPSVKSIIKIKHIKCSKNLEGWPNGKPELTLAIYGIKTDKTTDLKKKRTFDMTSFDQNFDDWFFDWNPESWYEAYTLHAVEEDPGSDFEITITAKIGVKKSIEGVIDVSADAAISKKFKFSSPEDCGTSDLFFYDPSEQTIRFEKGKFWCEITIGE